MQKSWRSEHSCLRDLLDPISSFVQRRSSVKNPVKFAVQNVAWYKYKDSGIALLPIMESYHGMLRGKFADLTRKSNRGNSANIASQVKT